MKKFSYVALGTMMAASACLLAACGGDVPTNVEMDHYVISIACQSEEGEQEVMKSLIAAYAQKRPDVEVQLQSFTGKDFEVFMNQVSQDEENSPNIIWTSDSYHARWEQYFTDLRPYYEASAETDYSLYYESMLDTAAINGQFKPTKNYTGEFRKGDWDTNSDGKEHYKQHSQYGLYFAPRDYNKPTILCNTALFEMLDTQYEQYYKAQNSVTEMPTDYVSMTTRLEAIVAGNDWDDLADLFAFATTGAQRIQYVLAYAETLGTKGQKVVKQWQYKTMLDLKLSWEPVYTTIFTAMGIDTILNADGSLNLSASEIQLASLHELMYAENNLYYSDLDDQNFKNGETFMRVVSRPSVLSARKNLVQIHEDYYQKHGKAPLQAIRIPTEKIAGGCSGYAINNIYEGRGITVNGVYQSYTDLCWDFLKFIITKEGQEIAGATGSNIPILKSLHSAQTNGGETPAWRSVEGLESMDQDAWLAGEELKQEWFNVYKSNYRIRFRNTIQSFFASFQRKDYGSSTLSALIAKTADEYAAANPTGNLR